MSKLQRIADSLEADAREIDRARGQENTPKHLWVHARRTAVHATRQVLAALDAGTNLLGPLRPDGLFRFDRKNEDSLLWYWRTVVMTWVRSKCPDEFAADAGAFDFPKVKTD